MIRVPSDLATGAAGTNVATVVPPRVAKLLRGIWVEHRVIVLLAAAYLAVGSGWLVTHGSTVYFRWGYPLVWQIWFVLTVLWCFWQYLRSPTRVVRILTLHRSASAALTIAILAPFQSTFQSLKFAIPAYPWDEWLSRVDVALHGGAPWTWWVPSNRALVIVDRLYAAWFLLIVVFVMWASWSSHRWLRARALVSASLLWIVGGSVAAWLMASAGPCYYSRVVEGPNPYDELAQRIESRILIANGAQQRLWRMRAEGRWDATSGISAMPSMHVAMAVLMAIVAWRRSRFVGALAWLYVGVVQVGSVVLAWHYAIDGYVGAALAAACWYGSEPLARYSFPRTAVQSPT